jgi:hypothetical protein
VGTLLGAGLSGRQKEILAKHMENNRLEDNQWRTRTR